MKIFFGIGTYVINEYSGKTGKRNRAKILLQNASKITYSSKPSFSSPCALGRSFGSNDKHLRKNAAVPGLPEWWL